MYVLGEASTTAETITPREDQFKDDDGKYLVVPLVVILVVMLLSLLVYCMAKRRKMSKLRSDIARLYHFDHRELEWERLNRYEQSCYGSRNVLSSIQDSQDYMPINNL